MKNISLKCNWCKMVSIRARKAVISSWSYVSGSKDRRFHVGCIQDMVYKSWRNGGIDQPIRGKEEDYATNFTTCLSLKIELPIDPEEERDADPSESATQKVADRMMKDIGDGKNPFDKAREFLELLGSGVGSGSSNVKLVWRLLLLKIREGMTWLAGTPVGRAGRKVWTTVTQPSKLWDELISPVLRWLHSRLCELASRMLTGSSSHGRSLDYAQAYSMDSI